jgi:hypothetical protein
MTKTSTPSSALAERGHWVTMPCPICGVSKSKPCLDTMGHRHPNSHPERRVWSTFVQRTLPEPTEGLARELARELERRWANNPIKNRELGAKATLLSQRERDAILTALRQPTAQTNEVLREALRPFAELADYIAQEQSAFDGDAHEVQIENWPYTLSVGWLRRARALTTTTPGDAA